MAHSTTSKRPSKPRPDFPLFPHATGRWAKKVRGKFHYFGKVANDPKGQAALELWLEQKDALLAGRTPRVKTEGLIVQDLVNRFLLAKRHLLDTREIVDRTFVEHFTTCKRVIDTFGWDRLVVDLASDDFERLRQDIAKNWGPVRLGNEIQRVRSLFKYGFEAGLIERPVRFGPSFKKPSRKVFRLHRAKKGSRMIEPPDLHRIIAKAGVAMKAMTLLGLNCGFGNEDVAKLSIKMLDLKAGWMVYPRDKTGISRRCPLWPETIAALQEALAKRPHPADRAHDELVFLTKFKRPWQCCELSEDDGDEASAQNGQAGNNGAPKQYTGPKLKQDDAVSKKFTKILKALKLHRPGLGFYSLRHVFQTIGEEARDDVAVDAIMGHARDDMASVYRERIDDDRLRRVSEYMRTWLYSADQKATVANDESTPKKAC
jgi:integrase